MLGSPLVIAQTPLAAVLQVLDVPLARQSHPPAGRDLPGQHLVNVLISAVGHAARSSSMTLP